MEDPRQRKVAMLKKLQSCIGADQASMMYRLASNVTDEGSLFVEVLCT